ncbi:MAG: ATP-dependent DNA helicase [Acidobacteria bacterium]|nr:ATP-dependent DNA helicase [Acidobacteriota bacterium]
MPEVPALPDAAGPQPEQSLARPDRGAGSSADEGLPEGLEPQVGEALADGGVLARAMSAFEPRPGQRRMAAAAARILESGGVLLAEAGTGTGKTLAYLVPAILSGQRVLVSTGTRNLQDQIFYKDLPALGDALGVRVRATYMKGRGNYLCRHRFEAARTAAQDSLLPSPDRRWLEPLAEWAEQTETGDRAEVEDLPDDLPLWNDIAATSENCIGTDCPAYQECFVTTMRQRAAESDIVIVNHHLLCADAAVRQGAYGEVIPACDVAVIDEAHQLEDVATQYFGISISTRRFDELDRDVHRLVTGETATLEIEEGAEREIFTLLDRARDGARLLFGALAPAAAASGERTRMTSETLAPAAEMGRRLGSCLEDLGGALARLAKGSPNADLTSLARRTGELRTQLAFLLAAADSAYVYFLERRSRTIVLRAAPIDVSSIVRELLLDRMQAAILTSATLTVDASFAYLRGRLGIGEATELRVPSEFDYGEQAVLYLPRDMPVPGRPGFGAAVARQVAGLLQVTRGRAFVLFTSYATLREVQVRLEAGLPYPILVQGSAPRTVLLREFRATPNAVLLATSSFWQGVDVAGEALSCVVIDKIPFAPPGDPLTAARLERIAEEGGNPFADYQVPLAILTLLQGLGRLLRHRTDRGVLALLDPRLHTRGYGYRFLESMPPAPVTHDLAEVDRFFNGGGADVEPGRRDRGGGGPR